MTKTRTMTAAAVAASLLAAPAFAQDWTGFYAGGQVGYGDQRSAGLKSNGWQNGLQAGYTHDFGGVVVGGEVDMRAVNATINGAPIKDNIALKARVGTDLNGFLVYGTAGVVRGMFDTGTAKVSENGVTYGVGVERPVAENWTVGLEVLKTDFRKNYSGSSDLHDTSASLRVNYRF